MDTRFTKKIYSRLFFSLFGVAILCFTLSSATFAAPAIPMGQQAIIPPMGQQEITPPMGQPPEGQAMDSEEVFGKESGRIHPFLIVQGRWTDNLFTTKTHKKKDFITTIAPGVWIAIPGNRTKLLSIDTRPTSPAGLQLSRVKPKGARKYQAYLMYSPEFELYAKHSKHNHINHKAEGMLQWNLSSGLSFDLIDVYRQKEDIAGNNVRDTLYRYNSNLLDFIATYQPSEKLIFRLGYSNYYLNYDESENHFRDRMDNAFDVYAFYKIKPKTSIFLQYGRTYIDFDMNKVLDSIEDKYYAGINWEMTGKSRGRFKLGFIDKNFENKTSEDQDGFSFELQTIHNLSPKRALQVNAFRNFNESDFSSATGFYATGVDLGILQRFSKKWTGAFNVSFEKDSYNGSDREDDFLRMGPAIRYKAKDWLFFDLAFYWTNCDSNMDQYSYKVHELIGSVTREMSWTSRSMKTMILTVPCGYLQKEPSGFP